MPQELLAQRILNNRLANEPREDLETIGQPTRYPSVVAADRALQESLITGDAGSLPIYAETNLNQNIVPDAVRAVHSELASRQLQDEFLRRIEEATDDQQKIDVMAEFSADINRNDANLRTLAYIRYLTDHNERSDLWTDAAFDKYRFLMTPDDAKQLRTELSQEGYEELVDVLGDVPAQLAQDSALDIAGEWFKLVGIPFQDIVANMVAKEAGLPGIDMQYIRTGKFRQDLRDYLASLSESELIDTVRRISEAFQKAESDPIYGPLLSDFSIVDFWMGVLDEEVLGRRDPNAPGTKLDSVVSTLSTVLDYLYVTGVVAKAAGGAKGIKSVLTNTFPTLSGRLAARTGGQKATDITELLTRADDVAATFNIDTATRVSVVIPKPDNVLDDLKVVSDTVVKAAREAEDKAQALLDISSLVPRNLLTPVEQLETIRRTTDALSTLATPQVRASGTTLQLMENNQGFVVNALLGSSDTSGWMRLGDALRVAHKLDPDQNVIQIVERTKAGRLRNVFKDAESQRRALKDIADPDRNKPWTPTGYNQTKEYYIRYKQERFWHPTDKLIFPDKTVMRSGGNLLNRIVRAPFAALGKFGLPPRYRFTDEATATFNRLYALDQRLVRASEAIFKPYFHLGNADKKAVMHVADWGEEFARLNEKAPRITDVLSEFPDITDAQLNGYIAYRTGLDAWYSIFNTRLYREWHGKGFKTARHDVLPHYHGRALDQSEATKAASVYDPVSAAGVKLTQSDVEDLYVRGGRIMEIDTPITEANKLGQRYTYIKIDPTDGYEVGALSTRPLKYTPGYVPRFYEDPYIIVKRYTGLTINGKPAKAVGGASDSRFTEAIRTAPTRALADQEVANYNANRTAKHYVYEVVYSNDLSVNEQTSQIKALIHRQGRLFWDERSAKRLPNLEGNPADIMDPVKALERATSLVARQTASEDYLAGIKKSFAETYNDVLETVDFNKLTNGEILGRLQRRKNVTSAKRQAEAAAYWDYLRSMDGVDSVLWESIRTRALEMAQGLGRITGEKAVKFQRGLENLVGTVHPLLAARSTVFNAFMVFRPPRQALMQTLQISFLTPIDPAYIGSGRIIKDGMALAAGMALKRGIDTGIKEASLAKSMGLSTSDFKLLVDRLDKSGLLDTVDVHSFAGGVRRWRKQAIDAPLGGIRRAYGATRDHLQRYGFDWGERNNLRFTYLVAQRKYLRENNKTISQLTDADWDQIMTNTQDLALGMIRTNQFGYQQGFASIATQFFSFGHKSLLTMLAQNPAISTLDAMKISGGMYLLYGADILGARDFVRDMLADSNLSEDFKDVLAGGFVDKIFNNVFQSVVDDWKDLDISGFAAPGPNLSRQYEALLDGIWQNPWAMAFGPTATLSSRVLESATFIGQLGMTDDTYTPAQKFQMIADSALRGLLPQYNDAVNAYLAAKMDTWLSASGEKLPLTASWNEILAKGIFGINSRDRINYYEYSGHKFKYREHRQNVADASKEFLIQAYGRYHRGEYGSFIEFLNETQIVASLLEDWPEEDRIWVLNYIMNSKGPEDKSLLEMIADDLSQGDVTREGAAHLRRMVPPEEWAAMDYWLDRIDSELEGANNQYLQQLQQEANN